MSRSAKRRYRRKMNEYHIAETNLARYLDRLEEALDQCKKEYDDFSRVYKEEADLYGSVMDDFNFKSQTYDKHINAVLEEAEDKKSLIMENKELAHERYEYYKELYENEDDDD